MLLPQSPLSPRSLRQTCMAHESYDVLGVSEDATPEDIVAQFKTKPRSHGPTNYRTRRLSRRSTKRTSTCKTRMPAAKAIRMARVTRVCWTCSFEPKPIPELVFIIPLTKLGILVSVKAESSGNMSDSETCMVKTFCKLIGVATKMANHPVTALSLVVKRTARGERDKLCQFPKSSKKSETQNPAVSKDIAKDFIAYSYGVFHSSKDQKDKVPHKLIDLHAHEASSAGRPGSPA
ncbi:hypothetical protein Pcac1_g21569 [Phytophthora cactorum]|uniref:J domain-containing protein n=3 Tax=Phytophthora cactorum TaxID=29920 RepID=A0A8T0ZLC2_9STRA|nr:hypothetical protein Pcac1_g21569 [Phytophthora cactorum]KAG2863344.1 hypothetical protein PC113_g5516 [Phytophthora cactorum]